MRGMLRDAVIMFVTAVRCTLLWFAASVANGQQWQWSPPAAHHAAVVSLKTPEGAATNCGSGCYVELPNGYRGVLTAAHCVSGYTTTVIFRDGTQLLGTSTVDATQADCGWILLKDPPTHLTPLSLAATPPQPGETVELAGYGASRGRLRHWYSRVSGPYATGMTGYVSDVMQGDSGGPVINARGEVCGVVTAGQSEIGQLGDCVIYRGTVGPSQPVVQSFLYRVGQRYGGLFIGVAGGCQGGNSCPQPQQRPQAQPYQAFPPQQQSPPAMVPVPALAPRPEPQLVIGVPALTELLAKDVRFRGTDGKDGAAGPPGKDAVLNYDKLVEAMAKDGRFRGPPGKDGTAGPAGAAGTPAAIDQAALAAQVATLLPPIYIRKTDAVTGETTSEPIRLGQGFTFIMHQAATPQK